MLDRLPLVLFLTLFGLTCFAGEASWNCQQDKTSKEWTCIGDKLPAPKQTVHTNPPPAPSVTEPAIIEQQPKTLINSSRKQPVAPIVPIAPKPTIASQPMDKPNDGELSSKNTDQTVNPVQSKITAGTQAKSTLTNSTIPSPAEPPILPAEKKPNQSKTGPTTQSDQAQTPQGWNCDSKGEEEGKWNCRLVGPDPKGEARVVASEERKFSLFRPTYNERQEQIFETLRDRFKNNPWGNCSIQVGTQRYYVPDKNLRIKADMDLDSNYSEIFDNEIGNYQGNVEMKRADQQASANSANYDSISETLDMHGDVYYSEGELAVHTDTASLKLASDEARLRDTQFIYPTTPMRGTAQGVYRDSESLSRYKDVTYTTCEPGNQDWIVHASDLKINRDVGRASAKNTWLEFKGIPVFYSPYLSFPTDDRRKSGFLAPVFGRTQKGGFMISTPYYWNIAPNIDATLRPRYYDRRGAFLAADLRYLTTNSAGSVRGEIMPEDTITKKPRYFASLKNSTHFTPNINSNLDLNLVSDQNYFSELGSALSFPNFSHVRSYGDLSYVDKGISLVGLLESYQTIDPTLTGRLRPYRRLPQIDLNLDRAFESLNLKTTFESEYVYFQHDRSPVITDTVPEGHRFNVKPSISFPLQTASGYITPKVSVQHTQYFLDNQGTGVNDIIGRTLPYVSVDGGLFLEKDLNLFNKSYLHTLEPRLYYLFVPRVNQDNIPIFDTSLYDFQFNSLFRDNRFSGLDRVQDANQISLALTSRLVDSNTGLEKLRFSIGDIIYFQNRNTTAPVVRVGRDFLKTATQTSSLSPIVAELGSQFNQHVSFDSSLQWDPDTNDIIRGNAQLHLVNNPGELLNLGFLYRKSNLIRDSLDSAIIDPFYKNDLAAVARFKNFRDTDLIVRSNDIIQSDFSFRYPIYDNWFAVGRWQYSFLYNKTQEAFFGFEKENCCWRFRIIGRQYINNLNTANSLSSPSVATAQSHLQTGIFFQIEFKGLTGIGESLDDFFTKSIYGYRKPDK